MQGRKRYELSIIIVNYIKYNLTIECVNSIVDYTKNLMYEIVIVDNDSPNNSYNIIKERFSDNPDINIIKNKRNSGFGDANNIAVKDCRAENLLFLNPDVKLIENNSLRFMLDRIEADSEIGIIGCKLLNEDMSLQYSCRRILKFNKFIISRTPIKKIFSKEKVSRINDQYLMKDYDHKNEKIVDWVMGSCILIKKSVFNEIGGFSKEYFMYFEDVDLCYKCNKYGYKVLYFPKIKMLHLHEQGSVKKINKLTFIHLKSMVQFYKKYRGIS